MQANINISTRNRSLRYLAMAALLALLGQTLGTAQAQAQSYQLGPGDRIGISVYGEPDMATEVRLGDTGMINFPFIGEIEATGKTTGELEQNIRERLVDGEYLLRPEVTVNILQYRPFYINGQVAAPGSYPFEPGLTLRKAVSIAGGFTERASRSNIDIMSDEEKPEPESGNILDTPISPDDIITVNERFF